MRLLAGLLAAATLFAQPAVTDARYAHLARGINLNRWFQYDGAVQITAADRDLLRNAGFTFVRIPVAPQYLLYDWSTPQRVERNLANLDHAIDLFLNSGMAVMLDFHADASYLDFYLTHSGGGESLINIWKLLAARYANRDPDLLFFEIMNEPDNRFTQKAWDEEQRQVLAAIHQIAPAHTVVVTPVRWSAIDALIEMTPCADPNVIYTLHYYSPAAFTHQGADWTSQPGIVDLRGVPYPSFLLDPETVPTHAPSPEAQNLLARYESEDWDAGRIDWDLRLASAWAKHWNVRVVVSEFGGFKRYSPPDSRARWLHDLRTSIERYGFGWAMWDYAAGFDLTQTNKGARTIDPLIGAALGLEHFAMWSNSDPIRATPIPAFSSARTVQIGGEAATAAAILATDINGDGSSDAIVAPNRFYLNSGDGVLIPGEFQGPAPTARSTISIVAGRFLRSTQRPGFFFPAPDAQSELVLPTDTNKLRAAAANLPQFARGISAAAADIDGDGVDDIALFHDSIELLHNNGDAHFEATLLSESPFSCGAFVKRRDSGIEDLIAIGPTARIFLNDGAGNFHEGPPLPEPATPAAPAVAGCAQAGDLNHDGYADLVIARANSLQILINNGDGTFRDETAMRMAPLPPAQSNIRSIALTSPVLLISRASQPPLIRIQNSEGKFVDTAWQPMNGPALAAPIDLNNDGLLDLIYARGEAPLIARFGRTPLK